MLHTQNPICLEYHTDEFTTLILGGIRLDRLDTLRTTLKIQCKDSKQAIRHNLDLYNDNQVHRLIRRTAGKLEFGMSIVQNMLEGLIEDLESYRLEAMEQEKKATEPEKIELSKQEINQATKFLKQQNLLEKTNELIGQSGVIGEENNRLLMYLIYTSRKQATPLNVISLGSSGAGKSHLQEKVAELIPQEDQIEITDLSQNAFYYFETTELKHKLVLIEDMDGAEKALYPIRELQSKRRITKTIVEKSSKGKSSTKRLTVEGPVSVAGCTTKERLYEDNANRSFLIYIDESEEQDQLILKHQRALAAGKVSTKAQEDIKQLFQNCQRILKPIKIVNPFAEQLILPKEVFKPRRTNAHYLAFIEAVTFYHQFQRAEKVNKNTGELYIETTLEDIAAANELVKEVLIRKSDELTGACRKYFERLKMHLLGKEQQTFTSSQVSKELRISHPSVKRYHRTLSEQGFLRYTKDKKTRRHTYRIISYEEYAALKTAVTTALDDVLLALRKQKSTSPGPVQKKSGPSKPKKASVL